MELAELIMERAINIKRELIGNYDIIVLMNQHDVFEILTSKEAYPYCTNTPDRRIFDMSIIVSNDVPKGNPKLVVEFR